MVAPMPPRPMAHLWRNPLCAIKAGAYRENAWRIAVRQSNSPMAQAWRNRRLGMVPEIGNFP